MKATLALGVAAGLVIFAAQAQGGQDDRAAPAPDAAGPVLEWDELAQGFGGRPVLRPAAAAPAFAAQAPAVELDVVDAHWMALTMWGEARGSGEEAMRAVGHVIDNRRRAGRHGAFVTETVTRPGSSAAGTRAIPIARRSRQSTFCLATAAISACGWPPGRSPTRYWRAGRPTRRRGRSSTIRPMSHRPGRKAWSPSGRSAATCSSAARAGPETVVAGRAERHLKPVTL
jgi:hypothetical protein